MRENRSLHELYVLLYDYMKYLESSRDFYIFRTGICIYITRMHNDDVISRTENDLLISHLKNNKPSDVLHSEFRYVPEWYGESYWWVRAESGFKVRLRFVEKMIEINKPEN
jgi:hypothetical protein